MVARASLFHQISVAPKAIATAMAAAAIRSPLVRRSGLTIRRSVGATRQRRPERLCGGGDADGGDDEGLAAGFGEPDKPVIVSMGNVAGSGGYFVAMAADKIVAEPATAPAATPPVRALPLLRWLAIHSVQ